MEEANWGRRICGRCLLPYPGENCDCEDVMGEESLVPESEDDG